MTRSIGEKLRSYKRTPGSFILMLLVMLSAIITFAVLLFLIAYILINGIPHIKPELFALKYTSENGSLFPALINTIIMTALSLIIAVPFGIFSAIFLVEYAKRGNKFINVIRITTETLSGIPSIVYGLFADELKNKKKGIGVIALANIITTILVIAIERISCRGK